MIDDLKSQGRVSVGADTESIATLFLAVIDGLELQSFYRPSMDSPAMVEMFSSIVIASPE